MSEYKTLDIRAAVELIERLLTERDDARRVATKLNLKLGETEARVEELEGFYGKLENYNPISGIGPATSRIPILKDGGKLARREGQGPIGTKRERGS